MWYETVHTRLGDQRENWSVAQANQWAAQILHTPVAFQAGEVGESALRYLEAVDRIVARISPCARAIYAPSISRVCNSYGVHLHEPDAIPLAGFPGYYKIKVGGLAIGGAILVSLTSGDQLGLTMSTALHEAMHIAQQALTEREARVLEGWLARQNLAHPYGLNTGYWDKRSEQEARAFENWANLKARAELFNGKRKPTHAFSRRL